MKKELKNYRIVSDNGEALLISQERFQSLLQTLEALAKGQNGSRPERTVKQPAMTGD